MNKKYEYECPDCGLIIQREKRQNPPGPCPHCGTEMERPLVTQKVFDKIREKAGRFCKNA